MAQVIVGTKKVKPLKYFHKQGQRRNTAKRPRALQTVFMACLLCSLLVGVTTVSAESVVTGRYVSASSVDIVLEISVGSPAPASLIVTQILPPGTDVLKGIPAFKKYNPATGRIRWLLRAVQPGRQILRLVLKRPLARGQIHAEIRCLDPQSGKMMTREVR